MTPSLLSLAALIISAAALAGAISSWWNLRSLNQLRQTFFEVSSGGNMEQVINSLVSNFHNLEDRQTELEKFSHQIKSNFNLAVQKVGIVRFNPFAGSGGNFSFSIAMLNGHNTGVVITSMHGREQNRVYTKKIQDGKSETALTDEEQRAVIIAVEYYNQQII